MRTGRPVTHGLTNDPTYCSYVSMIKRCYRAEESNFKYYGGRGIKVCEFLRTSPVNLIIHIGKRPEGMTLDRIDSNGNYSCGSCAECAELGWKPNIRWESKSVQANNRRNVRLFELFGKRKSLSQWAKELEVPKSVLQYRAKNGMDILAPKYRREYKKLIGFGRELKTKAEWARHLGISNQAFALRLASGKDPFRPKGK